MSTAKDKIRAGLALRPGYNSNFESLADLAGAPLDAVSLNKLVISVIDKRKHLAVKAEAIAKKLATFEHERAVALADMGRIKEARGDGTFSVTDTWSDAQRTAQLRREVSAERKRLAAEVETDRANIMMAIQKINSQVSAVRSGWEDAAAFLRRSTIGESARRIYRDNLAGTGPRHLQDAVRVAVATGDKALLSACLDELEQLPPEEQTRVNFSRQEASALVLGEAFADAQHNLASLDLATLEAEKHSTFLEGKKTAGLDLRIGLKRREVAVWAGDEELAASLAAAATAGEPNDGTEDATEAA